MIRSIELRPLYLITLLWVFHRITIKTSNCFLHSLVKFSLELNKTDNHATEEEDNYDEHFQSTPILLIPWNLKILPDQIRRLTWGSDLNFLAIDHKLILRYSKNVVCRLKRIQEAVKPSLTLKCYESSYRSFEFVLFLNTHSINLTFNVVESFRSTFVQNVCSFNQSFD